MEGHEIMEAEISVIYIGSKEVIGCQQHQKVGLSRKQCFWSPKRQHGPVDTDNRSAATRNASSKL